MADTTVYLNGGPCNGTNKNLTQAQFNSHVTTCRSTVYKYDKALTEQSELPVFSSSDSYGKAANTSYALTAPHAHKGWTSLMHSLNDHWRPALNESERNVNAALRSLSRGRKVRL